MSKLNSSNDEIDNILMVGGTLKCDGVTVYIDNPLNFEASGHPTGFWITNAQGWKVYFKTPDRIRAQKACDKLFGAGRYKVNSKI